MGVVARGDAVLSPGRRERSSRATTAAAGAVLLVCLAVSGVLPVQIARVGSDSMSPTLAAGDLVVLAEGDVVRRDVVVVQPPGWDRPVVKRVVGMGGDRVSIEDGVLLVDGVAVCETGIDATRIDGLFHQQVDVPEGELFLLGDDRRDAVDSRDFGTIREEDVLGVVPVRLWPRPGSIPAAGC